MIHQRCMEKLRQTARLRFPGDEDRQASYIADVLAASERHDETHYWISAHAFATLATKYRQPVRTELIATRRPICEACPEAQRITDRGVKCKDCGCGLVSFIHGKCKLNKWPDGPGGS